MGCRPPIRPHRGSQNFGLRLLPQHLVADPAKREIKQVVYTTGYLPIYPSTLLGTYPPTQLLTWVITHLGTPVHQYVTAYSSTQGTT
jgi:hypothetical protein